MDIDRGRQLGYSAIQSRTHDVERRRQKAAKIVAVIQHFLGRTNLDGLVAVDIGCSTGFTAARLRDSGADVVGTDIDHAALVSARERFPGITFVGADGENMPLPDNSVDIVVLSHIYEHVVDADAVMDQIHRVLKFDGAAYLAFGNRWQIIEPHYRLPFLSWLPPSMADIYIRLSGRGDNYYERFRSRRNLLKMTAGFQIWDYTMPILADPGPYSASDVVPPWARRMPLMLWKLTVPIMPTYVWIGTLGSSSPRGMATLNPKKL